MTDREPLTEPQRNLLAALRVAARERRPPPTYQELADELGYTSLRSVGHLVEQLEGKGYVRRRPGHRGLELVGERPGAGLPVLGVVAAGKPLAVEPDAAAEWFDFDAELGGDDRFMLRVRGESMIDQHIAPGDLVVIRRKPEPESGETVVVSIDGETTLKQYRELRGAKWLFPCGPGLEPFKLTEDRENLVLGVLTGVVRKPGKPRRRA
jgi:repressor LexA